MGGFAGPHHRDNSQPIRAGKILRLVALEAAASQLSKGESAGYETEVRDMIKMREKGALRRKIDEEKHLEIYGWLREGIRMKTYLHGPMDSAKNLKGDLDLPGRRKRYTSSRVEEEEDAQN